MRVGQDALHVEDRSGGNAGVEELEAEGLGILVGEMPDDFVAQHRLVLQPFGVGQKSRVLRHFRHAELLAQLQELAVVADRQVDAARLGREGVIGRDVGVSVADQHGLLARHEPVGRMRVLQRDAGVEQARLDRLALARFVAFYRGGENRVDGEQAGGDIDDGNAQAHATRVWRAVDADQAAHGLQHGVIAGIATQRPVAAEAGDAAMDQGGELLRQDLVIAKAPLFQRAGLEILDQRIGAFEQAQQHGLALGLRQIERQALLVAVHADEVRGLAVGVGRAPFARLVALRRFDLDDLGAKVAEQLGAIGAAQHARQVDDLPAGQRADLGSIRHQNSIPAAERVSSKPPCLSGQPGGRPVRRPSAANSSSRSPHRAGAAPKWWRSDRRPDRRC